MEKTITFKQKKGWLPRDFVVVGIIFGLTVAMYIIMVSAVANNYNNQEIINADFANHYSVLNQNLNKLDTSYSAVTATGGLNLVGTFNAVFTVIAMVFSGVGIYTNMAASAASDFLFLDKSTVLIFFQSVIAMMVAYLIFTWVSSVSRGKI